MNFSWANCCSAVVRMHRKCACGCKYLRYTQRRNIFGCIAVPRQFTHRFAAYCALLAMMCQLLLPFAHAAVMQSDVTPSWCSSQAQKGNLATSIPINDQGDDASNIIFCPVCAAASCHALVIPFNANLVPDHIEYSAILLPELNIHFTAQTFAISPPPRGPPLGL
jgi:hypothetical protein